MTTHSEITPNPYALATGGAAVRRLHMLHDIYAPAGRRVLNEAGLRLGMRIADFGCGVGVVTRMLAEMTGPLGSVTGIDVNSQQLVEARAGCDRARVRNVSFVERDACDTGLPRGSLDLVYCRFLLMHLPDPMKCLREMRDVLRPGGIIVAEDGDIATGMSIPPTATNAFADLLCRLGPRRGLDFSIGRSLYHKVIRAGFTKVNVEIHQPAMTRGENRFFLQWSVEEAAPSLLDAGIVTPEQLSRTLRDMQAAVADTDVLILAPQMSLVWGHKPAA
jgi:SAM-dependent methyltransferase